MAKRPLLSANMRAPANARPPKVDMLPSVRSSTAELPLPPAGEVPLQMLSIASARTLEGRAGAENFATIITDSLLAMSAASYLSWSQSFILPLRFSSYVLRTGQARPRTN